jgi:hypothetical protein
VPLSWWYSWACPAGVASCQSQGRDHENDEVGKGELDVTDVRPIFEIEFREN